MAFHDYGMLWLQDRLVYFIDRKPVSDIKVPVGYGDPMYMIVNLAMGSKWFGGVGVVDGELPQMVEFQIDRISAYQINPYRPFQQYKPQPGATPIKTNFSGGADDR